ncbi:hypothetical protein LTR66_017659, partial [Elasticomyces elasticus]
MAPQKSRLAEMEKPPPTPAAAADQPNPMEESQSRSLPIGATSANISQAQHDQSQDSNAIGQVDHKLGAVEDGRPANADGLQIDVGQEPRKPIASDIP